MAAQPGKYVVELTYQVELTVRNPDAVDRHEQEDWVRAYYTLSEEGMLGMLGDMVGVRGMSIDNCDGWADLDRDAVTAPYPILVATEVIERP